MYELRSWYHRQKEDALDAFLSVSRVPHHQTSSAATWCGVNAPSGQCTTCGLARLAYAWLMSGEPDSALAVYERVLTTPTNGLNEDDARWLPHTYRQLGELYDARSDTTNAIMYYNDFVELWKNADRELQPSVARVKRRITNLGGDPS